MAARTLLLLLLSVILHTLALPPWKVPFLAWFALIPFLFVVRQLQPRRAALAGLFWGTAAAWGFGYWVPPALASYYEQSVWFGYAFSLAASVVFCGSYYAGFAASACWVGKRTRGVRRVLLVSELWIVWEVARAELLSGDPWLLFGYALLPYGRLVQIADLGGVYLLSFLLVVANASILEAFAQRTRCLLVLPAALVVSAYAYGATRLAQPLPDSPRLPVMVVQGNNDLGSQWREEFYGEGLRQYIHLSLEGAKGRPVELMIWPESAVTFFLAHEPLYQKSIARLLRATEADLIVGAPHYEDPDPARPWFFNSAFYMTADGQIRDRYDKVHLLPFAEYFPLKTIGFLRRRFERVRFFTPGADAKLLDTRFGRVATVICFEGIFPDLVRRQMAAGAFFLINLSNDAWLGTGAGPEQHLQMVALRAIENRTWVIRATTTGISTIIDPFGRIVSRTKSSVATTLEAEIVPMQVATLYKHVGDSFAYFCLLTSILAAALIATRGRSS